jgi:hypothetical protein
MIEDSPESFIQRWRAFAADVQLFARTEGSPLLECMANGVIVQLLDRTGPYIAGPGRHRVILNPTVERLTGVEPGAEGASLEVTGLGELRGAGRVIGGEGRLTVVDCGVPLVVSVMDEAAERFEDGSLVRFEGVPPVHGFVVLETTRSRRVDAGESADDAM